MEKEELQERNITNKDLLEGALEANQYGIETINKESKILRAIIKALNTNKILSSRKKEAEDELSHYKESLIKKEGQIRNIKRLIELNETPEGSVIVDLMFKVFTNR